MEYKDDDDGDLLGKDRDYRGEPPSNETPTATTDPEAELMRKSSAMAVRLSGGVTHLKKIQ